MADEQIIYLSPNEELTTVRERLEQTQARRIILVIPPQTKLRSHVGWRLLHSRARELSKDVLVISSDRQVRAVAKAADFRVADSLESPSTSKSRPPSRPGRVGTSGRSSPRPRNSAAARGAPENRASIPRQRDASQRRYYSGNDPQLDQQTTQELGNEVGSDEMITGGSSASSTFNSRENQYGQDYDFLIDSAPSIRPLVPPQEDEDPDLLIEDLNVVQRIRQAAQQSDVNSSGYPPERRSPLETRPRSNNSTYAPNEQDDDPFAYMDDVQPASLPEQHGSTFIDEFDTSVPDISERPTDVIVDGEIEDLGDEGDFFTHKSPPPSPWPSSNVEEANVPESSRIYGMRPRNSAMGNVPYTPMQDEEEEDTQELLPAEQPSQPSPAPTVRQTGMRNPPSGTRTPQPIIPPQSRAVPTRSGSSQAQKRPVSNRPATAPRATRTTPRKARDGSTAAIGLIASILFFLILAALAYFGPSATVAITVPSQAFSLKSVKFTANATSKLDLKNARLPAELLTFDTHADGSGTASGSSPSATQIGTGFVIFTNNFTQSIVIPTGVTISTSGNNGVPFKTDGESKVPANGGKIAVTIHAQNPGASGIVGANAINSIPPSSITQIEQDPSNNGITIPPNNLTVNNPDATTPGAGSVSVVSLDDVKALQTQLDQQQLQPKIDQWMSNHISRDDVAGQPLKVENAVPTPALGQQVSNGKFSEHLTLHMTILVVRAATIQTALRAELNTAAAKLHPGYTLVPEQQLNLSKPNNTSPADGKSVVFSYANPAGQIAKLPSEQQLASELTGKKINSAESDLKGGKLGLSNVKDAHISVSPSFIPLMPFRSERIQITFRAVPGNGLKQK